MLDIQQWQQQFKKHLSATLSLFKTPRTHLAEMWQSSVPVHLSGVLLRVDGHGSNPELSAGSEHTDCDFP